MSQQCVRNGLIASLIRPAGNLTGEATLAAELGPKRLELLLELLPRPGTSRCWSAPQCQIELPGSKQDDELYETYREEKVQSNQGNSEGQ
jgi:hypothetical protein